MPHSLSKEKEKRKRVIEKRKTGAVCSVKLHDSPKYREK